MSTTHHNDKVRAYGIVMTQEDKSLHFQHLAEGVSYREHLDDPQFSLNIYIQEVVPVFNDKLVHVTLPPDS